MYCRSVTVLNINLGTSFASLIFAISGAFVVDRVGRRTLYFYTLLVVSVVWIVITTCTALYNEKGNVGAADVAILFVNLFGVAFSFAITNLQALYPVEVLSYEQRGKGMGFQTLMNNIATLANQVSHIFLLQPRTVTNIHSLVCQSPLQRVGGIQISSSLFGTSLRHALFTSSSW